MGEKQNQPFQLSFNTSLRVDFQGSRVTSDGGLLLVRELDERLGLSALITENIMDDRRGKNTQLPLPAANQALPSIVVASAMACLPRATVWNPTGIRSRRAPYNQTFVPNESWLNFRKKGELVPLSHRAR